MSKVNPILSGASKTASNQSQFLVDKLNTIKSANSAAWVSAARATLTRNFWGFPSSPTGNVIDINQQPKKSYGLDAPIMTQTIVNSLEPYGSKAPELVKGRASGWAQIANLSHEATFEKIQASFRAAERGDMTRLFGYCRDFFIQSSAIQSALNKRKLSIIADKWKILPTDAKNPDDVVASKVIQKLVNDYENFNDFLIHSMNAIVFPVSVSEKVFEPVDGDASFNDGENEYKLRYKIKKLYDIDYQLVNWRLPYLPQGPINIGGQPVLPATPLPTQTMTDRPEDTIWNPDQWEPDIRFWSVLDNGLINYSYAYLYAPDPNRHIIYRSNLSLGMSRENYGGLWKSLLFLGMMQLMGLDVFLLCLQKYGMPVVIGKVDTSQVDTVEQIMAAFGQLNILRAIAVNKDAEIDFIEMNYAGAADAHTKFLDFIDNQINLLILGQTLDSNKSTGGMGVGKESLQSDVRQDVIKFDRLQLANCLKHQLFRQLLDINGYKGSCEIVWGGGVTAEENEINSRTILNYHTAGFDLTDEALQVVSEKIGIPLQRVIQPVVQEKPMADINNDETNDKKDK